MLKSLEKSITESALRKHLLPKILTELEPSMLQSEAVTVITSSPNLLNTLLALAINKNKQVLEVCTAQAMKDRGYPDWAKCHCIPTLLMHLWMFEVEMYRVVSQRTSFIDQSVGEIVGSLGLSLNGDYTGHDVFVALLETQPGYTPAKRAAIMNTVGFYTLGRLNYLLGKNSELPVRYTNKRIIAFADVVTSEEKDTSSSKRMVACLDCTKSKDRLQWLPLSDRLRLDDRVLFWPSV